MDRPLWPRLVSASGGLTELAELDRLALRQPINLADPATPYRVEARPDFSRVPALVRDYPLVVELPARARKLHEILGPAGFVYQVMVVQH